jgi:hypothetical protein
LAGGSDATGGDDPEDVLILVVDLDGAPLQADPTGRDGHAVHGGLQGAPVANRDRQAGVVAAHGDLSDRLIDFVLTWRVLVRW